MKIIIEPLCNVHSHLRQGKDIMRALILLAIQGGADVILPMPNTTHGLITCKQVLEYIRLANSFVPLNCPLAFLPTIMITESTTKAEVIKCSKAGIKDAKIYPLGRTTKSQNGVRNYGLLSTIMRVCEEVGIKIHLHPEHPWMAFSNRDAEFAFLPVADMLLQQTNATIIWEHGTDARCIPFWKEMADTNRFFVTLTAHHLAGNEDMAFGDVRMVCKPPIKTENDRLAMIRLVEENHTWLMAGGDDAPHRTSAKHVYQGQCACGAYTAPFLLQLYAHALDNLLQSGNEGRQIFINFTSRNARRLHGLPAPSGTIPITRQEFLVPDFYPIGAWRVEPPFAGKKLKYSL